MTSFLGNLVARNAGAVEGIRPWLPTRFEPVVGGEGLAETSEVRERAGDAGVAVPAAPGQPPEPVRAESVEFVPARSERIRMDRADAPRNPVTVQLTAAETEPAQTTPQPVRSSEPLVRERVRERPVFVERLITRPEEAQPSGDTEPPARKLEPSVPDSSAGRHAELLRPLTLLIPDAPVPTPAFDTPRAPGAGREPGAPMAPAAVTVGQWGDPDPPAPGRKTGPIRQSQPAQATPGRSEPDIHVTIGRVEVRATTAAATSTSRRTAPQPMSLEEYQRRRGSGGQR
jgi:hypothetical protein